MAEEAQYEVGIEYTSKGAANVAQELDRIGDLLDNFVRQGNVSEKTADAMGSAFVKMAGNVSRLSGRVEKSTGSVQESSDAWAKFRAEVLKTDKAYGNAMKAAAAKGVESPFEAVQGKISDKEIDDFEAMQEAQTSALNRASQARTKARRDEAAEAERIRKADVARGNAQIQYEERQKAQFLKIQAEKAAAEKKAADARAATLGGRNYANASVLYDAEIEAQKRNAQQFSATIKARMQDEVAAERQALATQKATEATQRQTQSLPTLRYALYDVSQTLAVAGAGMTGFSALSLGAAVSYERAFADVIRTNDSLMQSQTQARQVFRDFMDLASEIPMSFQGLSEIGTLAGQLGVASSHLEAFTKTTAQFSAVTGESIDTTATAFGRLDALLPDVQGNYDALGSSILNVGINSVATEGEVISITTQLAGVGNQAGLTADEVVGLSGALASVGIQPELARGTITRLFGQISRAVSAGGDSLESFAAISGQSADEFAAKWDSAPMEATLDFFRGVQAQGKDAEAALRAVGITSVRDVPAILRLSQTMDSVLIPALADAKTGFEDGSQLAENYGVISETTAAKLQMLANNFQSLLATLGESATVFGGALDLLNNFLTSLRKMQEDPIIGFVSQATVAVVALGGVFLLLTAALTRGAASMLAWKTAMQQAGVQATGLSGQVRALTLSLTGLDAQQSKAALSGGRLSGALKGATAAAALLVAVPVAQWVSDWAAKMQGGVVDSTALSDALLKISPDASAQLSGDIKNVINQATQSIGSSTETATWVQTLTNSTVAPLVSAFRTGMSDADKETELGLQRMGQRLSVFGQEAMGPDWFAGAFSIFDNSYAELDKFEAAWIQAWQSASSESQKQEILNSLEELKASVVEAGGSAEAFEYNFQDFYNTIGSGVDQTLLAAEANEEYANSYESVQDAMLAIVDDVYASVNAQYAMYDALSDVGQAFIQNGAAVAFTGSEMQAAISNIIESSGGAGTAAANLQVFFDYLVKGGYASASQLSQLKQVIAGLLDEAGGGKVSDFTPTLTVPDFSGFVDGMNQARQSASGAADAVKEVKEEVRTLKDYASDLREVMSRAFEFRYGAEEARDAVTSAWRAIKDANASSKQGVIDAKQKIKDLRLELSGLKADLKSLKGDRAGILADISKNESWLATAREFGDTARVEQIEAKLAELRGDLAQNTQKLKEKNNELSKTQKEQKKANKDLKDAQAATSKSLKGNSAAAIENRNTIRDLVSKYQDQIIALADSGASQDTIKAKTKELKKEFEDQAVQLGFNRDEVKKYSESFTDMATVIKNVPRNLTVKVKASTSPAVKALNEFRAKAKDKGAAAGKAAGSAFKNALKGAGSGITLPAPKVKDMAPPIPFKSWKAFVDSGSIFRKGTVPTKSVMDALRGNIKKGYAQGGYTGPGGKYQPAGIVHRGEYVIPKRDVNQATGMPYADALGRLMNGQRGYANGGYVRPAAAPSGSGQVALSAGTIQQLANVLQTRLFVDGRELGNITSGAYSQATRVGAS